MNPKPPPAWMVRLNVAILRRGLKVGSQHLLMVPGRRTRQPRSTPISVASVAGVRYIVAAFGDAAWVANVRAAESGTLTRGGAMERVRFVEVPTRERGPILRAFIDQVRGGRRFFGESSADDIVAAAERYPVFRVEG
jgi:deazaflavin-dependent oxidoreductase (nitroreductase family)